MQSIFTQVVEKIANRFGKAANNLVAVRQQAATRRMPKRLQMHVPAAIGAIFVGLLSCSASAPSHATSTATGLAPKQGAVAVRPAAAGNTGSGGEEMVWSLIVKPHHRAGKRLDAALRAHDAGDLSRLANTEMKVLRQMSGQQHVLQLGHPVTLSQARVIAARLMKDSSVELAEPDRVVYPAAIPSDPDYAIRQWHYMPPAGSNLGGANLPTAWDITLGSGNVTVAVLDTGYRQHADLAAVLPGYDFIGATSVINGTTVANGDGDGRDADASDPGDFVAAGVCGVGTAARNSSWHGTFVAGTIAALMNNGKGGTGIAPNVRILPVRVLGRCGGLTSDIVDGMRWSAGLYSIPGVGANPNVANILNMSLASSGTAGCSNAFQSAVNDVVAAGKIIVAAAGNDGSGTVSQPANCSGVIAVTANAIDGDNATYANIGPQVTISAPGGGCGTMAAGCTSLISVNGPGVYSLSNRSTTTPDTSAGGDTYAVMVGTSMAAPHVSGVVALMLSLNPALTPAQVTSMLRASARPHPAGSTCALASNAGKCGAGLLDAYAALTMVAPAVSMAQPSPVVGPNSLVTLSASATAPVGRTIVSYLWTASPSNPAPIALSNANTLNAFFIAPAVGIYSFTLTVVDSDGKAGTTTATVRVNTAPVLTAAAGADVVAGNALQFKLGATDVDGDTPIFHSVSLPAGATLDADGNFSWPSASPVGKYSVVYYASDNFDASPQGVVSVNVTGSTGGGGGGSFDGESLLALAALAACMRVNRAVIRRRARGRTIRATRATR
jgi:serine protease